MARIRTQPSICLNIGCGPKHRDGFINVDVVENTKPDLLCDWKDLLDHFKPASIAVIQAEHFIEHLPPWEHNEFLLICRKLLKADGELQLECPDLLNACLNFVAQHAALPITGTLDLKMNLYPMYANPANKVMPYDRHMWGFSKVTMQQDLANVGFNRILWVKPRSVAGEPRDMRVHARSDART